MRSKYKVHLRGGVTIKVKGDDFKVSYDTDGKVTEWSLSNANRWVFFSPQDIIAVEKL